MKVDKVTYQKVFPISLYCTERIGVEISVDEGESPEQVLDEAKRIVEEWQKESRPTELLTPDVSSPEVVPAKERQPPQPLIGLTPVQEQKLVEQIESVKTVEILRVYDKIVNNPLRPLPEAKKAYDNKLKELLKHGL